MQTSIVQSLAGVSGAEGGKVLPSTPSTRNRFGDLFSQLMKDKSAIDSDPDLDETEPSDIEIPDEFPLGGEVNKQHPEAVKIPVISILETPGIAKNIVASEVNPKQPKSPEIAGPAEQTLGIPTQISQPLSGWQGSPDMPKAQNRSGDIEQKTDKALAHQLQNWKLVNPQGQQPANTKLKALNLPQIPAIQYEKLSVSSGFQLPQVSPSNTQNGSIQVQGLQQIFIDQPIEEHSPISVPTKTQVTNERNKIRQPTPEFEQLKKFGLRITGGYTLQYFKSQKPIDGTDAHQVTPPTMAVPHTQTLPKDSAAASVTQFATGTSKIDVSSEVIDTFVSNVENAEAELGRASANFALSTPPATALETPRAGTIRFAGSQMVDALIRQPDQPVEIALNPEELGRVRIVLSYLDSGLTVAISAERPETLDLMRRHIDQLAAEFRQLGYENIGFEFSGGNANSSDQFETSSQSSSDQMTDIPDPKTLLPVSTQATGVDIRL